ncbi:MAG TPA: DUF3313 domain-containing protein, partial [Myxococcota bacterium]|nr:DUF3313 domain-containing protein [Myxococcota bacterium]
MNKVNADGDRRSRHGQTCRLLGTVALAAIVFGCSTTQEVVPVMKGGHCVYLSPEVCPMLALGSGPNQPGMRYVAQNVNWSQYTKVMVSPVMVWGSAKSQLSAADSWTYLG